MLPAVLCFAAALVASTSAVCSHSMSCPCGSSNKSYTFCIDDKSSQGNPCDRWLQCETCQEGVPYCITCPSGHSGRFCTKVPHRKPIRRKRQYDNSRYPGGDPDVYCVPQDYVRYGKVVVHTIQGTTVEDTDDMEYPAGTQLEYTCNNGYAMEGLKFLKCELTGFWSSDAPNCTSTIGRHSLIYCVPQESIVNGRVIVHTTQGTSVDDTDDMDYPAGTRLEYSCNGGYYLVGTKEMKCEPSGFWTASPPECHTDCGVSIVDPIQKVTNGNRTVAGEWPWMVAISVPARYGRTEIICGGALLDKRTVLSAAHCFPSNKTTSQFILQFGKLLRRNVRENGLEIRRSVEVIRHPNFNEVTYENDIALIKLESNLPYTDKIQPICLPTSQTTEANLAPGTMGYVTGYGVNEKHLLSDELMVAQLPVQSARSCSESYAKHNLSLNVGDGMFCAGYPQGGISACKGDSGSPLVFYNTASHRFVLEGCVSFNVRGECGQPDRFTVFTKIGNYMNWIRKNRRRT